MWKLSPWCSRKDSAAIYVEEEDRKEREREFGRVSSNWRFVYPQNWIPLSDSIWGDQGRGMYVLLSIIYSSCNIIESTNPIRRNYRDDDRCWTHLAYVHTYPIQFEWSLPLHKVLTWPAFSREFWYAILLRQSLFFFSLCVCVCIQTARVHVCIIRAGHE